MTKQRVTFHGTNFGPLVTDLVGKYTHPEVIVMQQHFLYRAQIARPRMFRYGWVFKRGVMSNALAAIKPVLRAEADLHRTPAFKLLMLDLEPIDKDPGFSKLQIMQDALGLCWTKLGQGIQVGFYANPFHRGLASKSRPAVRFFDSILPMQTAIFLMCLFSSKHPTRWFQHGMTMTRRLLERIEPIRDGRPIVAYVWPCQSKGAGSALIPDRKLFEQMTLLHDAGVQLSVGGLGENKDAEVVHVIEMARAIVGQGNPT